MVGRGLTFSSTSTLILLLRASLETFGVSIVALVYIHVTFVFCNSKVAILGTFKNMKCLLFGSIKLFQFLGLCRILLSQVRNASGKHKKSCKRVWIPILNLGFKKLHRHSPLVGIAPNGGLERELFPRKISLIQVLELESFHVICLDG